MKKFIKEFREFINRGNVMDMAVGIIIGGAFTSIVSSLVDDIINPILGLFGGMNFDQLKWNILGEVTLNYGKFISAVLNFLIMALVIFTIMRVMNSAAEKLNHNKEEKPAAPTTKKCPYCKTEIAIDALADEKKDTVTMNCNRPFIIIVSTSDGLPIFMGAVNRVA